MDQGFLYVTYRPNPRPNTSQFHLSVDTLVLCPKHLPRPTQNKHKILDDTCLRDFTAPTLLILRSPIARRLVEKSTTRLFPHPGILSTARIDYFRMSVNVLGAFIDVEAQIRVQLSEETSASSRGRGRIMKIA